MLEHCSIPLRYAVYACGLTVFFCLAPAKVIADEAVTPPVTPEKPAAPRTPKPASKFASVKDDARLEALLSEADLPGITKEVSLREALEMADSRNLSLVELRMELEKADVRLKQAWGLMVPTVQAEMNYIRSDHADKISMGGLTGAGGGSTIVVNPADTLTGGISASMPLVNANIWKGIQISKESTEVSKLTVEDYRRGILFGTGKAFYTALMTRSMVEVYKEQIRATAHHLDVAEKKFAAGSGLRIDVLRAGIELERAEKSLSNAKLSLATACDALGVLTGLDTLVMPKDTNRLSLQELDETAMVQDALTHRLDLIVKKKQRDLAEDKIDSAWMVLLPTLSLAWQGTYKFSELGAMGDADRSRWNLILNLTVPLFNYNDYHGITESRIEKRQAEAQIETLSQTIGQEVRQAHREYQTALTDVENATRQVDLATESLKLAETGFEIGVGTSLEVTDARRTHIEAKLNLMTSKLQTQLALINLLQSLGKDPLKVRSTEGVISPAPQLD